MSGAVKLYTDSAEDGGWLHSTSVPETRQITPRNAKKAREQWAPAMSEDLEIALYFVSP